METEYRIIYIMKMEKHSAVKPNKSNLCLLTQQYAWLEDTFISQEGSYIQRLWMCDSKLGVCQELRLERPELSCSGGGNNDYKPMKVRVESIITHRHSKLQVNLEKVPLQFLSHLGPPLRQWHTAQGQVYLTRGRQGLWLCQQTTQQKKTPVIWWTWESGKVWEV